MTVLERLERRFGRYAIRNLTIVLALGQLFGFFVGNANPEILEDWVLVPNRVLQGEYWRFILFPFYPPGLGPLALFGIYLFYLMGTALEYEWGHLRYNIYILIAYVATIAIAFLQPEVPATNAYIDASVFLAFAWLFPDFELLIFFLLPVKVKYLALLTWLWFFYRIGFGSWMDRLLAITAVVNFLMFFGAAIVRRVRYGQSKMQRAVQRIRDSQKPFHVCTVCGVTEKQDRHMEFRVCSKCFGEREYCSNHIFSHTHVPAPTQEPSATP